MGTGPKLAVKVTPCACAGGATLREVHGVVVAGSVPVPGLVWAFGSASPAMTQAAAHDTAVSSTALAASPAGTGASASDHAPPVLVSGSRRPVPAPALGQIGFVTLTTSGSVTPAGRQPSTATHRNARDDTRLMARPSP
jgi:hypothetical protein